MTTLASPTFQQIKGAMAETNRRFNEEVFGKRNFDALDKIYTSAARILPPGAPMISGRPAIKKFWSDLVSGAHATSAVLTSIDVMHSGDGAVEIGSARLTVAPPGQPEAQMEVKYVVFWREEDGLWKWHVDIWNPNA
jgi:ketosteroid isomerase-like protein